MSQSPQNREASRRDFMKKSSMIVAGSAALAGTNVNIARAAHSFGSDLIKIGLIGCGGRGTGAAIQALNTKGGDMKLVAIGDVFPDRVASCFRSIKGQHGDKVDVPQERQFSGFDAYKKVLETNCDLVILATPPGFRPLHFSAAVAAGKHVFMEKPVAVDPQGVRKVLEAGEAAKQKNLAVAVGLQRRHERKYMSTIKALQDGAIGDIVLARAYWNGSTPWVKPRQESWTELEYQMRNWYYFNWLCGDHIVEQHIHNLDVINWLMGGPPKSAQGQGGCEVRKGKDYGEIFDHHMIEFTYGNGTTMLSQCRHIPNCWNNVSEHVAGTKGTADVGSGRIKGPDGSVIHDFSKEGADGHQQEHHDLFADLRAGRTPNEAEWGAKSTMTAIFGRMATYSGQMLDWDKAINSSINFAPVDTLEKLTTMQDAALCVPEGPGKYKLAAPGVTKVV